MTKLRQLFWLSTLKKSVSHWASNRCLVTHSITTHLTSDKGSIVDGTVKSVDAKGAVILLADEVEGYLRASEISTDRVEDARNLLKEGDAVNAMIINIDRKSRSINLIY